MKKRYLPLLLCVLPAVLPVTAQAAQTSGASGQTSFLLYASVTSAQTAHALADALLQRAASWEDLTSPTDSGQMCFTQTTKLLQRLNAARTAQDLPPLTIDESLTSQAMERAAELARSFRTSPLWRLAYDNGTYLCTSDGSETRALGRLTPAAVLHAWMNLPEARANLLSEDHTLLGIGCFVQDGYTCWVLLFGSRTTFRFLLPPGGLYRGLADGPVPSGGE